MAVRSDKRWVLPEGTAEPAKVIAAELGVHPVAAQVLAARGYRTVEQVSDFLADGLDKLPDPLTMKGMPAAVERLARAVLQHERTTLWGDYDVDGVSSTALLSLFLAQLGHPVETYIPHRLEEGYGLNRAGIERIASDGSRVLVTLDCGITSYAEVKLAQDRGVDVVVVDHHAVPETMPPAVAVLNPMQPGCGYPTRGLCAAGVAFNLCIGLRKHLRERGFFATRPEPNLKSMLDLVALATVADVVPLVGVNRILVKQGLKVLTEAKRPGIQALKDVAGLSGDDITASHVGYRLGPRINAAGRLDDAALGLRLLCARTYDEALPLARQLDAANAERQQIEKQILVEAIESAESSIKRGVRGLVLWSEGWHPGVVGIVASRVVERFHRPTVMIGVRDGIGRGSARSIEGFHLYDALKPCAVHLERFGGHKMAAGMSVLPEKAAAFRAAFEEICEQRLTDDDLQSRCRVDAVIRPAELDGRAIQAILKLAPFGAGHPEPVLAVTGVKTVPKVMASKIEGEPGHLKLMVESAPHLDFIGFRLAEKLPLTEGPIDLAFALSVDDFRGVPRVQLKLRDIRATTAAAALAWSAPRAAHAPAH
jgi:single-stranded-DNA-specific exonuclease